MESNKKLPLFIGAAIIFFILYVILAAKPLHKEYQFQPVWKINITKQVSPLKENEQLYYFRLGKNLGYFTDEGNIILYKTFPNLASISDTYFCLYDNYARNTTFYENSGTAKGVINFEGFPYIVDDMIYVMLPGGNSFIKCDSDGNKEWKYEGILPITAFKAGPKYTAAGFADGSINIFNNENGEAEIQFAPGGSDLPVVLGIDISPDGEYIAAVCGHNKQRFVLAHREENQPKIIFHTFLDTNSANQCLVHFCNDESRVIYNFENTIGIYDFKKNQNDLIKINSKIISIRETDNLVFLLGKAGKKYSVYILEKTNTLEGSFSFIAETAFIQTGYNTLYVGKDDSISKISLERK
ncbi:MAG: hypothetical protein IJR80_01895 [Treponema sp.]|nr:hypothetical protein [Treponema sp.]